MKYLKKLFQTFGAVSFFKKNYQKIQKSFEKSKKYGTMNL